MTYPIQMSIKLHFKGVMPLEITNWFIEGEDPEMLKPERFLTNLFKKLKKGKGYKTIFPRGLRLLDNYANGSDLYKGHIEQVLNAKLYSYNPEDLFMISLKPFVTNVIPTEFVPTQDKYLLAFNHVVKDDIAMAAISSNFYVDTALANHWEIMNEHIKKYEASDYYFAYGIVDTDFGFYVVDKSNTSRAISIVSINEVNTNDEGEG